MHWPTINYWIAVKRIIRYLKDTSMHGLHITPNFFNLLQAYADTDWVGYLDDRRSTSGYLIFMIAS